MTLGNMRKLDRGRAHAGILDPAAFDVVFAPPCHDDKIVTRATFD